MQTVKENEKKAQRKKTLNCTERPITIQILQRQRRRTQTQKNGKVTPVEEEVLKTKITSKGPALFGSVQNLKEESKTSRSKVKYFLDTEPAYTKNRTVRRKTPRLKVIAYDIDKIWSIDLAYDNKLADYNKKNILWLQWISCPAIYVHSR